MIRVESRPTRLGDPLPHLEPPGGKCRTAMATKCAILLGEETWIILPYWTRIDTVDGWSFQRLGCREGMCHRPLGRVSLVAQPSSRRVNQMKNLYLFGASVFHSSLRPMMPTKLMLVLPRAQQTREFRGPSRFLQWLIVSYRSMQVRFSDFIHWGAFDSMDEEG
jgi:hypothetical protein